MKLDKKFINKVNNYCYEDKTYDYGKTGIIITMSLLVVLVIFYFIVPDNLIKKIIKIVLIIDSFALIFSFGLLLICPHKVYKQLKEDKKNEKDKIL
jgi:L-asparagine transporter-like permease